MQVAADALTLGQRGQSPDLGLRQPQFQVATDRAHVEVIARAARKTGQRHDEDMQGRNAEPRPPCGREQGGHCRGTEPQARTPGEGLTASDAGGRELYHRYGDEPIYGVTALPQGVLVAGNQASSVFRRQDLLDPRTGRVIRQVSAFLQPIAGDQPFWF